MAAHLNKLGVDGMSGDESDHASGHRRYVVCKLNWRSNEITSVLRVLDALALVFHWTSNGRPKPGKFPHVQIDSDRLEIREPVRNLPRNFYNSDWLNTLDKYERQALNMGKPIELAISSRLLRCVTMLHRQEGILIFGSSQPCSQVQGCIRPATTSDPKRRGSYSKQWSNIPRCEAQWRCISSK
jgi:hypothetical protein